MSGVADDTEEPSLPPSASMGKVQPKRSFAFLENEQYRGVKSPLIAPFLKDHIERVEDEIAEIKPFVRMYYECKARLDAFEMTKRITRITSALSAIMLTLGGAGFGASKDLWAVETYGKVIGLASVMLVCGSFFVRVKDA